MPPAAVVEEFAEAVSTTDGDRLAKVFTADGIYHDLVYGAVRGPENIARFMDRVKRDGSAYRMEMRDVLADEHLAYCRYRFSFVAEREPGRGRRIAVEGMAQFRFENGLISEFTESANQGVTLVQVGLPAETIERVLQRWSESMLADPGMAAHISDG